MKIFLLMGYYDDPNADEMEDKSGWDNIALFKSVLEATAFVKNIIHREKYNIYRLVESEFDKDMTDCEEWELFKGVFYKLTKIQQIEPVKEPEFAAGIE